MKHIRYSCFSSKYLKPSRLSLHTNGLTSRGHREKKWINKPLFYDLTLDDKGNVTLTLEEKWSGDNDRLVNYNSNAIFNCVGVGQIKLITTCESTKEAWKILQTAYEGTSDVKRSKLSILTTKFEELCMKDDETLVDFYSRLWDIANKSFALGERIPESKLVWKIVRSLPDRFQSKVIVVEESKNLDIMKIDELMGSLGMSSGCTSLLILYTNLN